MPGWMLPWLCAWFIRYRENAAFPALEVSAFISASFASSVAASARVASASPWPNLQPGAVQGRGRSSPGNGMCARMYRSFRLGHLQFFSKLFISATVSGFLGTWRSAVSRAHMHQPEAAICSVCRSAATSKTKYILGLTSTVSPSTSQERHFVRMLLLTCAKFSPRSRVEPSRSSEQLPKPNIRRCCADRER